jgi:hypothetical protein
MELICPAIAIGMGGMAGCGVIVAVVYGAKALAEQLARIEEMSKRSQNTLPADKDNEDDRDIPWAMPADKR